MEKKYKSKYLADSNVTAAQILCEFICERIAKKDGKTLPIKFWNKKEWNQTFRRQIGAANVLLKEYELSTIINALKHKKGEWIISLGAKKQIKEIIDKYIINPLVEPEKIEVVLNGADLLLKEKGNLEEVITQSKERPLWERLSK